MGAKFQPYATATGRLSLGNDIQGSECGIDGWVFVSQYPSCDHCLSGGRWRCHSCHIASGADRWDMWLPALLYWSSNLFHHTRIWICKPAICPARKAVHFVSIGRVLGKLERAVRLAYGWSPSTENNSSLGKTQSCSWKEVLDKTGVMLGSTAAIL